MASKGKGGNTVKTVWEIAEPIAVSLGYELWDVRFEKEGPNWFLRILIDRADGETMDTDACELASRAVDPIIDEADAIEQSYFLEVGSPGLGRRLTREHHYEVCEGEAVSARFIHTESGERDIAGTLCRTENGWCIRNENGDTPLVESAVAFVKLDDDLDL